MAKPAGRELPPFHASFVEMLGELAQHPRVLVTHVTPPPKFTKSGKGTFEDKLGRTKGVPRPLREVLAALGGLVVRWDVAKAPIAKKPKPRPFLDRRELETPPFAAGCIAIPHHHHFTGQDLQGITWFPEDADDQAETVAGAPYPRATFRKSLRILDDFDQYYTASWVALPGGPEGVVLGRDAHADYDTRVVPIETYLHLLRVTRGARALRVAFFEGRYQLPESVPPLDEILDRVEQEVS